jgi:hypothetical protein
MGEARVLSINISGGGVPKLPVAEAEVGALGTRVSEKVHIEDSRLYARVMKGESIRQGDGVELI